MKILVVASNGKVSRLVIKEALKRGIEVVASSRKENKSDASTFIQKDIMDLTKEDIAGADAIVDGFGANTPWTLKMHTKTSQHLADLVSGTDTRLIVVGGAGSLYMTPEHTTQLFETPDFPAVFRPISKAQSAALTEMRKRTDVKWTFISPAADFQADGIATGEYLMGGEEYITNDKGESKISYADYAKGLVDVLESGKYIQERICFIGK